MLSLISSRCIVICICRTWSKYINIQSETRWIFIEKDKNEKYKLTRLKCFDCNSPIIRPQIKISTLPPISFHPLRFFLLFFRLRDLQRWTLFQSIESRLAPTRLFATPRALKRAYARSCEGKWNGWMREYKKKKKKKIVQVERNNITVKTFSIKTIDRNTIYDFYSHRMITMVYGRNNAPTREKWIKVSKCLITRVLVYTRKKCKK